MLVDISREVGNYLYNVFFMKLTWLVLVGYVGLSAALEFGSRFLGTSAAARFAVGFLVALLIGFEAATLRRFTLGRRSFANAGVIVADDMEAAERRFFDAWVKSGGAAPRVVSPSRQPAPAPDVIGLFPQPGPRR